MQAVSYQAFKHFYEYSNEKLRYRDILGQFPFKFVYDKILKLKENNKGYRKCVWQ